jgi:hypothetical protein
MPVEGDIIGIDTDSAVVRARNDLEVPIPPGLPVKGGRITGARLTISWIFTEFSRAPVLAHPYVATTIEGLPAPTNRPHPRR